MRRIQAVLAFLLISQLALSQTRHFIYLQADQEQAFYVKIGEETKSSSASGYMIIPRLRDSVVEFTVGFPKKVFPEYRFRVSLGNRDKGMALKNFGEKGWGLFDLQTLDLTMGTLASMAKTELAVIATTKVTDSFTTVLASVIGDSTLVQTEILTPEFVPAATATDSLSVLRTAAIKDSSTVSVVQVTLPDPAGSKPGPAVSGASANEVATLPGSGSSVLGNPQAASQNQPAQTSVNPAIPAVQAPKEPVDAVKAGPDSILASQPLVDTVSKSLNNSVSKDQPSMPAMSNLDSVSGKLEMDSNRQQSAPQSDVVSSKPISAGAGQEPAEADAGKPIQREGEPTRKLLEYVDSSGVQIVFSDKDFSGSFDTISIWIPRKPVIFKNAEDDIQKKPDISEGRALRPDCTAMISIQELGQLRRRMESIPDEDAKVAAAVRELKRYCFTTEQVRSLLVVFFREEGRYKLLDAAYARVSDPVVFRELQAVLKDTYFIYRFRKLVGLQ